MKKVILTLCILISCAFYSISAEGVKATSQLHLKNGELVTGDIVSRDDQKVVITNNDDGIKYEYSTEEIAYITHAKKAKRYDSSRFRGMIDFAYGLGVGSPRNNVFGVETSFGYQFNHYLYLGGGLAVNFHKEVADSYPFREDLATGEEKRCAPDNRFPYIPIYANLRSQLFEGDKITPFVDVKIGASFINHVGLYFSPAIGVHFPTKSTFSFNLSLGYAMQQSEYKLWVRGNTPGAIPDGSGGSYLLKKPMLSNFNVRIGIEF